MENYNTIFNLIIISLLSGFIGFIIAKTIYKKDRSKYYVLRKSLLDQEIKKHSV